MTKEQTITAIQEIEKKKTLYLDSNILPNLDQYTPQQILSTMQVTPKKYIKEKDIGGRTVLYTPREYSQKCLNIAFNFNVSCEIIDKECEVVKKTTKKGATDHYSAVVTCRFTFKMGEEKVSRDVVGSFLMPVTKINTKGDAYKAAVSRAWAVVADTFGIGSDLEAQNTKVYEAIIEAEVVTPEEKERNAELEKHEKAIAKITTKKALSEYYQKHKGFGAEFDKLVSNRKEELSSNQKTDANS